MDFEAQLIGCPTLTREKQSIFKRLLKSSFFKKINSRKINYFLIFGSVMKNKLENIFWCLVMSWKMSWKITY